MENSNKSAIVWIAVLCATITLISLFTKPAHREQIFNTIVPKDSITVERENLKPFDPNSANYRTLIESGVPRNVAVSLIKWREAGKVFRIKEDVALCHNLSDSLYFVLEPYIIISEEHRIKPQQRDLRDTTARHRTIEYQPFRIDTATAEYLHTLGFSIRQARLVVRYRDMIGGYRDMAEFEECYAVDSAMAARLEPYIIFADTTTADTLKQQELRLPIDINSADSATLVRLRGIGAKSAQHIIRYRILLGGYYSETQISELEVVTEENFRKILPQIWCDSTKIKKIFINFARPKELEVHPYVSNQMLRRIVNHRELKGGWSTIEEMIESNILNDEEAARIAPYLDFGTNPE
jgi:DNA uptake protein ComE-like DNA-binding protein